MAVGFPTKVNYATGDVLSATNMNDLSGTVNLLDGTQYSGGKNAIINSDFGINQRSFTSTTADGAFTFDRWRTSTGGTGTTTYSTQTFTPGTAPVVGYEGKNYAQIVTSGFTGGAGDFSLFVQKIESVRTFAGQTATLSFWAKASTGTPKIAAEAQQDFGTGGSPSASVNTAFGAVTISTSWARYSMTLAIPSISGKTLGTANNDHLALDFWFNAGSTSATRASNIGNQNNTFQIWGVQLENASTASAFATASGNSKQGELAACQRYYWRNTAPVSSTTMTPFGSCFSTTVMRTYLPFPVVMRTSPTAVEYSGLQTYDLSAFQTITTLDFNNANTAGALISGNVASGLTQFRPTTIYASANTSYIGFSAEL